MLLRLDPHDTIAAIASPPGPAPRGIVRLTGPDAWRIVPGVFLPDDDRPLPTRPEVRPGRLRLEGITPLLPASVAFWPGPRTYTGQPVVEIHTIGSPPLLERLLADLLTRGARLAEPGEFTLRAFLAGRIDLTRAEAVLGVIDARNRDQLDTALRQLAGGLSMPIEKLRNRLLDLLAHVEATLDFVDEPDVDLLGRETLIEETSAFSRELARLAEHLDSRERAEGRLRVVLAGPPNAGKSRLFNALLGEARALVSPLAGTTRDYLVAPLRIGGLAIELIDTAGFETRDSDIDRQAQSHRAEQSVRADLLLLCRCSDASEIVLPDRPPGVPVLDVWTKCDLAPAPGEGEIATSAETGEGLDALREAIAGALRAVEGEASGGTTARCRESLVLASRCLANASETLALDGGVELVAIELRQAIDELGKVVGAVVTDDILDRIFRRFCIGK